MISKLNHKNRYVVLLIIVIISLLIIGTQFYQRSQSNDIPLADREYYYKKSTENLGGAGEFSRLSPSPNSSALVLEFDYNYDNVTIVDNNIIVEDFVEYLNGDNILERYQFNMTLSKEGDIKEVRIVPAY